MNDEEKLEETFDFNSGETKKILRKARLFTLIRSAAVSLLVFILLSAIILIANMLWLDYIAENKLIDERLLDLVARPNTYTTHAQNNNGFLAGEAEFVTYRIVGDRPIYNGTYRIGYSILPFIQGFHGTSRVQLIEIMKNEFYANEGEFSFYDYNYYNKVGNREMIFYHPGIEYENYPNDMALLEEIADDKCLEMAFSFDQDYSLEEVQAMLPDEVKTVWYWVDTYSEKNLDSMRGHYADFIGADGEPTGEKKYVEPRLLPANQVYGMKAVDSSGDKKDDPRSQFIGGIKLGFNKETGRYHKLFQDLFEVLSNENNEITEDNIKIIGAVVTGDATSMKLLRDHDFIRTSALGIVTDKY